MDPQIPNFLAIPPILKEAIERANQTRGNAHDFAENPVADLDISEGDLKACLAWSIMHANSHVSPNVKSVFAGLQYLAKRKVNLGPDTDGSLGKLLTIADQVFGTNNREVQVQYIIEHAKKFANEQFERMQSGAITPAAYGLELTKMLSPLMATAVSSTLETSLCEVYGSVMSHLIGLSKEAGGPAKLKEILSKQVVHPHQVSLYYVLMMFSSEDKRKQLAALLNPEELRSLLLSKAVSSVGTSFLACLVANHMLDESTLAKAFGIDSDLSAVYAIAKKDPHGIPNESHFAELKKWTENQANPTARLKAMCFIACIGNGCLDARYDKMATDYLSTQDPKQIFTDLSTEQVVTFLKMPSSVLLQGNTQFSEALPFLEKMASTPEGLQEILEIAKVKGNEDLGISSPEKCMAALPLLRSLLDTSEGIKLVARIVVDQVTLLMGKGVTPENAQPIVALLLDIAKKRDGAVILWNVLKEPRKADIVVPLPLMVAWGRSLELPLALLLKAHIGTSEINEMVRISINKVKNDEKGFANFPEEYLFQLFTYIKNYDRTLLYDVLATIEPLLSKLSSEQIKTVLLTEDDTGYPIIFNQEKLRTLLVDTSEPSLVRSSHVDPQDLREMLLLPDLKGIGNTFLLAFVSGFLDKEVARKALGVDFDPEEVKGYLPEGEQNSSPYLSYWVAMSKWVDRDQDTKSLVNTLYIATMLGYGDVAFGRLERLSPQDRATFLGMFSQKDVESILKTRDVDGVPLSLNPFARRYFIPWLEKMNPDKAFDLLLESDRERRALLHDPAALKEAVPLLSQLKIDIQELQFFKIFLKRDNNGNTILHSREGFAAALPIFRNFSPRLQERLLIEKNRYNERVLKTAMECEAIDEANLNSLYDHYDYMADQLKKEVAAYKKPPQDDESTGSAQPRIGSH